MLVSKRYKILFFSFLLVVGFSCSNGGHSNEKVITTETVMKQPQSPQITHTAPSVDHSVTTRSSGEAEQVKEEETISKPLVEKKKVARKHHWTQEEIEKYKFYQLAKNSENNKKFSIFGNIFASGKENKDLSVLLFDGQGNLVKRTKVKPDYTFEFEELPTGDYSLVLSDRSVGVKAYVNVVSKDDDGKFLGMPEEDKESLTTTRKIKVGDRLTQAEIESRKLQVLSEEKENLSGRLSTSSPKSPMSGVALYGVNKDGLVVGETTSDSKGAFKFQTLKPGAHTLIQGTVNPDISATISKENNDESSLVPFAAGRVLTEDEIADLPNATVEQSSFKAENNDIRGKVFRNQTMKQEVGQSVWLLDEQGKLIAAAVPDKDGVFLFKSLKAQQYTVVVENADNNNSFIDIISPEQSYQKEFAARDDSNLVVLLSRPMTLNSLKEPVALKETKGGSISHAEAANVKEANLVYELGMQKMKLKDYEGAKEELLKAIKLKPDFVDAYIAHGKICELTQSYTDAINDYNDVLGFRPNHLTALYRRAYVENEKGEYDKAIKDFSTVIELYPDYSYPYFYRAVAENQTGDHIGALRDYQKMVSIDSTVQEAYFNKGSTHFQLNQYNKAVDSYDKALTLDSSDADVYYNRGQVHQIQGNYEQAIDDFNKAIKHGPIRNAYYEKANTYALMPNDQLAIESYNEAAKAYPADGETYLHRGVFYYNTGNNDAALEDFTKAIELNGKMGEYYFKRAVVLTKVKKKDEACNDFSTAYDLKYRDPEDEYFWKKYCKDRKIGSK